MAPAWQRVLSRVPQPGQARLARLTVPRCFWRPRTRPTPSSRPHVRHMRSKDPRVPNGAGDEPWRRAMAVGPIHRRASIRHDRRRRAGAGDCHPPEQEGDCGSGRCCHAYPQGNAGSPGFSGGDNAGRPMNRREHVSQFLSAVIRSDESSGASLRALHSKYAAWSPSQKPKKRDAPGGSAFYFPGKYSPQPGHRQAGSYELSHTTRRLDALPAGRGPERGRMAPMLASMQARVASR